MQDRLSFPSMVGMLAAFSVGVERAQKLKRAARALNVCIVSLTGLFVVYLCGEMGLQLLLWTAPGVKGFLKSMSL